MNFVDAAIALLAEQQRPLTVEELCQLALDRGLIDKPGAAPLRSMKGRLTTELNRGEGSRLLRLEGDLWALAPGAELTVPAAGDGGDGDEAGAAASAPDEVGDADELDDDDDDDDLDDDDDDDDDDLDADDLDTDDGLVADDQPGPAGPAQAPVSAEDELEDDEDELEDDEDDEDELEDDQAPEEPARVLSPEEVELQAIYGDESSTTTPAGTLAEYRDQLTADEDRAMLPEIVQERGGRRGREERGRRRGREGRRDREGRREGGGGGGPSAASASVVGAPGEAGPAAVGPAIEEFTVPEGGGTMADRAASVLSSIKGGQPVPVRQLAQMMRKRGLVTDEPERVWRPLKAALLQDQQRRQAIGLTPRVIYRGRDLFAYRGQGGATEAAEVRLENAIAAVADATRLALTRRLGELTLGAFEQLAHLYLTAAGYHGIEWIKRVDRSSYAVAREAGSAEPILVGVRAGNQPVDRRGVGELRAGVVAKNAGRGLLLAARELSDEAEAEAAKAGKPLGILAGPGFAAALVRVGVGIQNRAVPIGFLDADLFDRLGDA